MRVAVALLAAAFAALLLSAAGASAQSTVVEVIPLRYRAAAEVIPILQPMLAREGSISGFQGQLVVRTTPSNLEEIKRILASLDGAPRQLLISVRQESESERARSRVGVSADVGSDRGRVVIPPGDRDPRGGNVVLRDGDDRVRLHAQDERSTGSDHSMQSVRVMEGREAFVRFGQSVPVREQRVERAVVGGRVVERVVESTQYRDVNTGFYVVPRIAGQQVTLDISPQREALSKQALGAVSIQSVATTVSGRLGEWMEIGGIARDASGRESVLAGRAAGTVRDNSRVLIKVDEVR